MEGPIADQDPDDSGDAERSEVRSRPRPLGGGTGDAFRSFLQTIPLPAWLQDSDTLDVMAVNDALVALTRRARDELVGANILDLYDPADRVAVLRHLDRLRAPHDTQAEPPLIVRLAVAGGGSVSVRTASRAAPVVHPGARLVIAHEAAPRRSPSDLPPRPGSPEAAIAQSEQRYRTLFEVCPIAACVYDIESLDLLAVNDAMARQYDYTRDELLSMTVLDLVARDDLEVMREQLDELRVGPPQGVLRRPHIVRHRVRGGAEIDVELIEAPLVYGGAKAHLVLHKDVTEHKRAEVELVKRARVDAFRADLGAAMMADEPLPAHFARVVDAMVSHLDLDSAGVWVLDEASGQLELLASAGGLDGATAGGSRLRFGETWIGRSASRGAPILLDVTDPAMHPLEVAHARDRYIAYVAAFPLVTRGRVLGVVTAGSARSFPEDLVVLLRATAAQITHAVGAAFAYEALRIGESLSRSILANMLSALVTISEDGVIETANPAASTTFGYPRDEMIGRPFVSLFDIPSRDSKALLAEARGRVTERKGRKKSGETFPCDLRLFHLESLSGPGYAAILHDLSERHEVERLKAEFVSVVSHELRTPLTALRGSIGLLAGGVMGALPGEAMELLQIAERNTKRLISLVNDILDLERLQRGKLELFIQPVRALSIVDRSLEIMKPYADQERIRIDVRCTDEVVIGDGDRLVQVLVNLLSNAVKFSPGGASVEVSNEITSDSVLFRVADHGRGIPATHRRLIFERFGQVHTSDSREKGGTGLGLAISKAIVEQHDGAIGVESEVGKGSTFWFRVPRGL